MAEGSQLSSTNGEHNASLCHDSNVNTYCESLPGIGETLVIYYSQRFTYVSVTGKPEGIVYNAEVKNNLQDVLFAGTIGQNSVSQMKVIFPGEEGETAASSGPPVMIIAGAGAGVVVILTLIYFYNRRRSSSSGFVTRPSSQMEIPQGYLVDAGYSGKGDSICVSIAAPNENDGPQQQWIESYSEEYNRPFWYNTYTGESTWIRPIDFY